MVKIVENNKSIKTYMLIILKESMKFAMIGIILFFLIGVSILYLLLKIGIDQEIAALATGFIIAICIVIIDVKRLHSTDKIAECNRRIISRIFRTDK